MTTCFGLPKMYIIVKQLSKAKPTRKRHKLNCQKLPTKAVAIPVEDRTMKGLTALRFRQIRLTSDKADEIAASERGNSSVAISDPPEEESTDDGSAEEDRLRERRQIRVVTHPVELSEETKLNLSNKTDSAVVKSNTHLSGHSAVRNIRKVILPTMLARLFRP